MFGASGRSPCTGQDGHEEIAVCGASADALAGTSRSNLSVTPLLYRPMCGASSQPKWPTIKVETWPARVRLMVLGVHMTVTETRPEPARNERRESLRERVVSVGTGWALAQYALVTLVAALDGSGEWILDGASTCAHWVSQALDVEVCTAREWLRIGKALTDLPMTDAAFDEGLLSYSKVRLLTRFATRETEVELLERSEGVPAGRLGVVLAAWLSSRETPDETEVRLQKSRSVAWRTDPDGMIAGSFRLPPTMGKRLAEAIDAELVCCRKRAAVRGASADAWPSIAQQRADAFAMLLMGGGAHVLTEIVVHLRGDGATFDDGTPVPWSELERIAPASLFRALIHDADGRPINASGRRRHPSTRQKRVVVERDRVCVDCGATEFLEFDHEPDYETSGRTVIDELLLRCWACHRARHEAVGVALRVTRYTDQITTCYGRGTSSLGSCEVPTG